MRQVVCHAFGDFYLYFYSLFSLLKGYSFARPPFLLPTVGHVTTSPFPFLFPSYTTFNTYYRCVAPDGYIVSVKISLCVLLT